MDRRTRRRAVVADVHAELKGVAERRFHIGGELLDGGALRASRVGERRGGEVENGKQAQDGEGARKDVPREKRSPFASPVATNAQDSALLTT